MRTFLALAVTVAFAAPGHAGNDPTTTSRPARGESAPKPELERPAPSPDKKPAENKAVCTYVDRDQNAPSERVDCIAGRDPAPQRPVEKSPPNPPGNDATPSAR